ncbi:10 kDa chaperonin [Seminavis robusta]|uniref:20 kDa chaperonin, chloroplastic n=1 Tax=Seminavis robusta TaxID=568900 RepID=A0A9N8DIP3_9STRA|nr:10 kDa chaperonin [Seminavis robusta]|eukprot:Sro163_g073280.1 10 kDa chaperonin (221) ;mRNA; r:62101-62763
MAVTLDGEQIRGPITPLGNFVLVKVKDTLQATAGGVLLPDQSKERPTEGLVMEAGPGKIHPHTGIRITNPVTAGVSVLYGKFDGKPIEYKGEECQMIRDDDVMLYYTGVTMSLENVTPCRDYVLIEVPPKQEQLTSSGVVIADMVTKEDEVCEGFVIKVGEGRLNSSGEFSPSPVAIGEKVKFKDYAGNDVRIEGKDYVLVRMVEILCTAFNDVTEEHSP